MDVSADVPRLSNVGCLGPKDVVEPPVWVALSLWSASALLPSVTLAAWPFMVGLSGGVSMQVGGLGGGVLSTSTSIGGYPRGGYIFGIGMLVGTWADRVLAAMVSEALSGSTCSTPSPVPCGSFFGVSELMVKACSYTVGLLVSRCPAKCNMAQYVFVFKRS